METVPLLFTALLALCALPSAMALKCYECTNIPGYTAASQCDAENVGSVTCEGFLNRCMTVKYTLKIPNTSKSFNIVTKNCSTSILCDPSSPLSMCKFLTISEVISDCTTECCEGDLCNGAIRISGFIASFAAMLLALILNL